MWMCGNCGTENEDNFKFCWSCGHTREQSETVEVKEKVKEIPEQPEPRKEPIREVKKVEEGKKIEEIKRSEEPEPNEITKVEKRKSPQNEPELFATVLPYSSKLSDSNDSDWEIKVFRIALRLAGLVFLYQVALALPDLVTLTTMAIKGSENISDALTRELVIAIGQVIFYFILGIYLIASGRILIWLLPDR